MFICKLSYCLSFQFQIYTNSAEAKIPAVLDYLGTVVEVIFLSHASFLYCHRNALDLSKIITNSLAKNWIFHGLCFLRHILNTLSSFFEDLIIQHLK